MWCSVSSNFVAFESAVVTILLFFVVGCVLVRWKQYSDTAAKAVVEATLTTHKLIPFRFEACLDAAYCRFVFCRCRATLRPKENRRFVCHAPPTSHTCQPLCTLPAAHTFVFKIGWTGCTNGKTSSQSRHLRRSTAANSSENVSWAGPLVQLKHDSIWSEVSQS